MRPVEVTALIHIHDPRSDVRALVEAYRRELDASGRAWELLFVLDGVEGGPLAALRELQEQGAPVRVVTLKGSFGESLAFAAGAEQAHGRYLLTLPSYLQVDPKEIHTLLHELDEGAALVTPWRHPRVDPWVNRLQSGFFNLVIRSIIATRFHDLNCSFRGLRREVLEEITLYGDLFRFLPVIAERHGFRVKEVRVRHLQELGRHGFFGLGVYIRRLLDILAIVFLARFTQKPLRFFGVMGVVLMLLGLALAAEPVLRKIYGAGSLQDRPIFLVGILAFTFGVQLIGFGLVGEIIIFTQARQLREYKVDKVYEARGAGVGLPQRHPPAAAVPASRDKGVIVRALGPGEDAAWDRYVRAHPRGTPFHLSGWRRVVWECFRHEPLYLLAEEGETLRGVLPVFRARCFTNGLRRISAHISVPYAVYGGILADGSEVERELLKEACRRAENEGVGYLELRESEDRGYGLVGRSLYVGFVSDLPANPEECLERIPRKARAEARKARDRHGLLFREGMELDTFHRLFALNKRTLGTPCLPLRFFQAMEEEFGNRVHMHLVTTPAGEVAAAVLSFAWRDVLMPYYSGALKHLDRLGTNNFMYWSLMQWGAEHGFRRFDFGRSREGSGAYHFKKNMGFLPEALNYQFFLVKSEAPPSFHPGNPETDRARKLWSRLPLGLTVRLGARLSRYLP